MVPCRIHSPLVATQQLRTFQASTEHAAKNPANRFPAAGGTGEYQTITVRGSSTGRASKALEDPRMWESEPVLLEALEPLTQASPAEHSDSEAKVQREWKEQAFEYELEDLALGHRKGSTRSGASNLQAALDFSRGSCCWTSLSISCWNSTEVSATVRSALPSELRRSWSSTFPPSSPHQRPSRRRQQT